MVALFKKRVRLQKIRLRRDAISALIEEEPELLEAQCNRSMVIDKGAFREVESGLGHSDRFRQTIASPKSVQFIVEDGPELLFAFH